MTSHGKWLAAATVALCLTGPITARAQETNTTDDPPSTGWRKFGERRSSEPAAQPQASQQYDQQQYEQRQQPVPLPGQLTLPAGSWIKVRVDQPLSSDHNRPGDAFTATLTQPLVVNGFVIARRGQSIGGRVGEVEKAGRVKGTSSLGFELTDITLVDGQQMPLATQLISYSGDTSVGRDATAIGTTTGIGAAIGGAAAGGMGAGLGAIAGAAASTIGVLSTRGRATEVYPESVVSFRTTAPLTISTERSEQAFQPVRQEDYEQNHLQQRAAAPRVMAAPRPYYGDMYGGWPYYYGPGFYATKLLLRLRLRLSWRLRTPRRLSRTTLIDCALTALVSTGGSQGIFVFVLDQNAMRAPNCTTREPFLPVISPTEAGTLMLVPGFPRLA